MFRQRKRATDEPTEVYFEGKLFDVTDFVSRHPGGESVIRSHVGKDITTIMKGTQSGHQHSKAAYSLLHECDKKRNVKLQKDVDWERGIFFQVGHLGENYMPWIDKPVLREFLLFDNPLLDWLSTSRWYYVPVIWFPVAAFLFLRSWNSIAGALAIVFCCTGTALWSLMEYCIHRWLFHLEPPANSKFLISLHFLFHGIHHKAPFDERRLVFPPAAALMFFVVFYVFWHGMLSAPFANAIICGMVIGYVGYDLIHYYLHHGKPSPGSYLHALKRYHVKHHFVYKDRGFGISSWFWDGCFGTTFDNL